MRVGEVALNDTDLVNALLAAALYAQGGLLRLLHALGLAGAIAGQPAWPFASRLAIETLLLDHGLARQLAESLVLAALAALALLLGVAWRRPRAPLWGAALLALLLAPWPPRTLILTEAEPTSFHRSPTGFDARSIARGLALYDQHCAACHGSDGRGEGPRAASLPVWPPTLSAGLLWKREEGELLWRVLHGMQGHDGSPTMPGFAGTLQPDEVWAVLDAMKALSAGDSVRREASWAWPVRAPELTVDCAGQAPRLLSSWRGQHLRLVVSADAASAPREDPRLVTVLLRPPSAAASSAAAPRRPLGEISEGAVVDCSAGGDAAWQAYAHIAGLGEAQLAGTQFIVDRAGWLRALGRPGQADWSADDLLCRSVEPTARATTPATTPATSSPALPTRGQDGLGALLVRIDADPVRISQLGIAHGD